MVLLSDFATRVCALYLLLFCYINRIWYNVSFIAVAKVNTLPKFPSLSVHNCNVFYFFGSQPEHFLSVREKGRYKYESVAIFTCSLRYRSVFQLADFIISITNLRNMWSFCVFTILLHCICVSLTNQQQITQLHFKDSSHYSPTNRFPVALRTFPFYLQVYNVECADKMLLNKVDEIDLSMANGSTEAIIRQIDAPVPLLMIFKKYTVYDEETKKPSYLLKLLNIDQWMKNARNQQKHWFYAVVFVSFCRPFCGKCAPGNNYENSLPYKLSVYWLVSIIVIVYK